MAGPLANVDTKVAAIDLDVSRRLNWGRNIEMEFLTPDQSQIEGWKIELTLRKGFDRLTQDEKTRNDGSDVIFSVADLSGELGPVLLKKGLAIRVDGNTYGEVKSPPLAPNAATVYLLSCKARTLRTIFETKK